MICLREDARIPHTSAKLDRRDFLDDADELYVFPTVRWKGNISQCPATRRG